MTIDNITYIVGNETEFTHKGNIRTSIKARLPKGKNLIMIIKYEDGSFSTPTRTSFKANF